MDCPTLVKYAPDILQMIGTLIVLASAWHARAKLSRVVFSWDGQGEYLEELRSAVRGQFRDQSIGFACLLAGLVVKVLWGT